MAEQLLPEPTEALAAALVQQFRDDRLSGSVTITLHFLHGRDMPSDVSMHQRQVGARPRGARADLDSAPARGAG